MSDCETFWKLKVFFLFDGFLLANTTANGFYFKSLAKMKMKKKMPSSFFFIHNDTTNNSLDLNLNDHRVVAFSSSCTPSKTTSAVVEFLNKYSSMLVVIFLLIVSSRPCSSQLVGSERTMEQFLDRLLHESVYDRRIRPFYTDSKSKFFFVLESFRDSSWPIILFIL